MGFPYDSRPVVIEARGVEKTFRIPDHRVDTFKERALHPFAGSHYRELRALRDVSFDVHQGEFFGIVGRNGSGKSTLLKIMSSIYRADAGRIRMAGRLAPYKWPRRVRTVAALPRTPLGKLRRRELR